MSFEEDIETAAGLVDPALKAVVALESIDAAIVVTGSEIGFPVLAAQEMGPSVVGTMLLGALATMIEAGVLDRGAVVGMADELLAQRDPLAARAASSGIILPGQG